MYSPCCKLLGELVAQRLAGLVVLRDTFENAWLPAPVLQHLGRRLRPVRGTGRAMESCILCDGEKTMKDVSDSGKRQHEL